MKPEQLSPSEQIEYLEQEFLAKTTALGGLTNLLARRHAMIGIDATLDAYNQLKKELLTPTPKKVV